MGGPVRIAVAGAGLIGARHAAVIAASPDAALAGIADPAEAGKAVAGEFGASHFASLKELIAAGGVDGVIVATPNRLHVDNAMECVAAGLPVLVEKPLAADVAGAERLVSAAAAAGVPLLTGHHRRHNPLIQAAKAQIEAGRLGRIVAVHGHCWLFKPDEYFDIEWHRRPGAGPVFINLIHDIDLLRYLCGDVVAVQAMESNVIRGNEVEETAVIALRFASGALGTLTVSDTVVAPWSWELTARENPAYPPTGEGCYQIGGTHASLSLPDMTIWVNPGPRGWWQPLSATYTPHPAGDPLSRQISQFAAVIRGEEAPLVSGDDGLQALRIIAAAKAAAAAAGRGPAGEGAP